MPALDPVPCAAPDKRALRQTLQPLRAALASGRVALAFQPVFSAAGPRRVIFHEALLRLTDEAGAAIPLAEVIALAEARHTGRLLDCIALDLALSALARTPGLVLSVNMSARSIGHPRWLQVLALHLGRSAGIGERLVIEITEHTAIGTSAEVRGFIAALQRRGIAVAIDDFGAGRTTLAQLRDLPFDILKIDGSMVNGIAGDPGAQALTRALLDVAVHYGMLSVAERVECAADAAWLSGAGVDALQGFHLARPAREPALSGAN